MGPAFAILFWLIVSAVYGAIFLFFAGIFIVSWFKKWRWAAWLTGIPAGLMVIFAALLIGLYGFVIIDSMNPRSVYKNVFEAEAPTDVKDIKSDLFWFADSGTTYLKFNTTEERFKSLIPDDLSQTTPEELSRFGFGSGDRIEWWDFRKDAPNWIYYFREHGHNDRVSGSNFAAEWELMAFDPETGNAYYHFTGID